MFLLFLGSFVYQCYISKIEKLQLEEKLKFKAIIQNFSQSISDLVQDIIQVDINSKQTFLGFISYDRNIDLQSY
jgi:hypothetical protein